MKKDETPGGGDKLTSDIQDDHTAKESSSESHSTEIDPRIVELVRFLARSAAEKDYANLLEKARRKPGRGKETIQ